MKKLIFFIILSIIYSLVPAQNMIFTFIPKDASNIIDSISAINLTTGESVSIKGTNEISFSSTSVNANITPEGIKIYPNPCYGQAELQFSSKQNDDIKINLINTAGQIFASQKQQINQGFHKFKIRTKSNGMYIVQIIGNEYKFSQKIMCTGNSNNINSIEYIGLTSKITQKKSAVDNEPAVIHFYIYSGDKTTKIADSPSESKTYEVEFFECKDKEGRIYPAVQIGDQWWMAENLSYLPYVDSPYRTDYEESYCYVYDYDGRDIEEAKNTQYFKKFGALYNNPAAHKMCPNGWHLPSGEEWKHLEEYIYEDQEDYQINLGIYLKAAYSWENSRNGYDTYGFSGLPGGYLNDWEYFSNVGSDGFFWCYGPAADLYAPYRRLSDEFKQRTVQSYSGMSVRCMRYDEMNFLPLNVSIVDVSPISHMAAKTVINIEDIAEYGSYVPYHGVCWNTTGNPTIDDFKTDDVLGIGQYWSYLTNLAPNTTYYVRAYVIAIGYADTDTSTFYSDEKVFKSKSDENILDSITDSRDNNKYKIVKINSQWWMAENLKYLPSVNLPTTESYSEPCYYVFNYEGTNVNDAKAKDNYKSYGVLYNWPAASKACPNGWHLPDDDDWEKLAKYVSETILQESYNNDKDEWANLGKHLKATFGWWSNNESTNFYGFSGLPGGYYQADYYNFLRVGGIGYWWSSSQENNKFSNWYLTDNLYRSKQNYSNQGFSIRCVKEEETQYKAPSILTKEITDITSHSAECGGIVTDDGGLEVTSRGVCWNTSGNPTKEDYKTENGSGLGEFTSTIVGLSYGTNYFVCAYATNRIGTVYGEVLNFTTATISVPTVTTAVASNITSSSAISGGVVTDDGYANVTARGVVWDVNPNATIESNLGKTEDGNGTGDFVSQLSDLNDGTTYYIRAYAINSEGTGYGATVEFTTASITLPSVITAAVINITINSAQCGGTVTSDGNSAVSARGIVWNTTGNPTVENNLGKTVNGSRTGSFTSQLTGLLEDVTYYIRAYATNSKGTSYGEEKSFTTLVLSGTFTDSRDGNIYNFVTISTQTWMTENLAWLPDVSPPSSKSYTSAYYYVYGYNGTSITDAKTTDNYTTYGVLYNWPAALTACPSGWHLPTDDEWTTLVDFLGGSSVTGEKMKTTSGWTNNGNGSNSSGFSGLPGGYRSSNSNFNSLGRYCSWWSSTKNNTDTAWGRGLRYDYSYVDRGYTTKEHGFSVRCIKDEGISYSVPTVSTKEITDTSSYAAISGGNVTTDGGATVTSRGVCWNTSSNPSIEDNKTENGSELGEFISEITGLASNTTYYVRAYATNSIGTGYGEEKQFTTKNTVNNKSGYFIDERDSTMYKWVQIGNQTWMAENLAYSTGNESWAYNNDEKNVDIYGRLYSWNDALNACPNGWYLPSNEEWQQLVIFINDSEGPFDNNGINWEDIGKYLKSTYGWKNNGNGTDNYGFKALPSGRRSFLGTFATIGEGVLWWTNTEDNLNTTNARYRYINYINNSFNNGHTLKDYGFSVRCIKGEGTNYTILSVSTKEISETTSTTAISGGNITSDGGILIISRGVCWNTTGNPTINDSFTTDGESDGTFTSNIIGLNPNTTYYVRAYATNSIGTGYGNQISFTTSQDGELATISTNATIEINQNSVKTGGNITSDGGTTITLRGVCWNTSGNPSIDDNSSNSGTTGIGNFTINLTGLQDNTTYYLKAYAINSTGTSYGKEIIFTTCKEGADCSTISTCNKLLYSHIAINELNLNDQDYLEVHDLLYDVDRQNAYHIFTRNPETFMFRLSGVDLSSKDAWLSLEYARHETNHDITNKLINCNPAYTCKYLFFGNIHYTDLKLGQTANYSIVDETIPENLKQHVRYSIYIEKAINLNGNDLYVLLDEFSSYTGDGWFLSKYFESGLLPTISGGNETISGVDGTLNFMVWFGYYLKSARLNHPQAYSIIKSQVSTLEFIQTLWSKAEEVLDICYQYTSISGTSNPVRFIFDMDYFNAAYSDEVLSELDQIGITHKSKNYWSGTYLK